MQINKTEKENLCLRHVRERKYTGKKIKSKAERKRKRHFSSKEETWARLFKCAEPFLLISYLSYYSHLIYHICVCLHVRVYHCCSSHLMKIFLFFAQKKKNIFILNYGDTSVLHLLKKKNKIVLIYVKLLID